MTTAFEIDDVAKPIQRQNERYARAHVDGDVTTIDAMFTRDATCMPPGAELVVEQGTYVMTYGPGDATERGEYLNVWKPEDGAWRIHADIWNASA